MTANDRSHLTARSRSKASLPMRWLAENGRFSEVYDGHDMLDYGCGRGFDADWYGVCKYDPHYFPCGPIGRSYRVITCNYVLNVMPSDYQVEVLEEIWHLLDKGGVAYITVRRDVKKDGYTSKGTFQRNVVLDLPIEHEKKGAYCIYKMAKEEE